ncbi:MAG: hypothetical protein ACREQ5_05645 [Candidatus Dormibacteria bacterium]
MDFDFLLRFIGGVVCGMVLVFGGLILLPLVLFAVAFGVITFAAFLGATFIRAAFTDKD